MDISNIKNMIKEKFNSNAANGLDINFKFIVDKKDIYTLKIFNNQCDIIKEEQISQPDATFHLSEDTLLNIFNGNLNGMEEFMAGNIKIDGDVMTAMKLNELFAI